MNFQLLGLLGYVVGYILLLTLCEYLYRKKNVKAEYTRKLSHVVAALAALFWPYIFKGEVGYPLVLAATFFILLWIARKKGILPSVESVGRETYGSSFLAAGLGVTYFVSVFFGNYIFFTLPILIFALSDPIAALIGKMFKSKKIYDGKTIYGSLAFFISALIICLLYLPFADTDDFAISSSAIVPTIESYVFFLPFAVSGSIFILSLIVAAVSTFTEIISRKGVDNLTIPLSVSGVMILYHLILGL